MQYSKSSYIYIYILLQESNTDARVGIIINAKNDENSKSDINKIVLSALNALSPERAILYARKVIKEDNAALIANGNFKIEVKHMQYIQYVCTDVLKMISH